MKQLTQSELTQLQQHYNRSAIFAKGDCERAAISFAAQVNGHVRQMFANDRFTYWVFWRKE